MRQQGFDQLTDFRALWQSLGRDESVAAMTVTSAVQIAAGTYSEDRLLLDVLGWSRVADGQVELLLPIKDVAGALKRLRGGADALLKARLGCSGAATHPDTAGQARLTIAACDLLLSEA
jgi:hypothetical protein